jgi:hypothetical protein
LEEEGRLPNEYPSSRRWMMNPKRILRQALVLSTFSLLVLALGPREALAFNPQPEPPKELQEVPEAPQAPAQLPAVKPPTGPLPSPGMVKGGLLPHFNPDPKPPAGAQMMKMPTQPPAGAALMQKVMPPKPGGEAGEVIPKVEIHTSGSPGAEGMRKIVMPKPGPGKGEVPTEQTSTNFEEVKVTYTEYPGSTEGNVETEFKVEKGE